MYKVIFLGLIFFLAGCKPRIKDVEYVRDEKHNICFATGYVNGKGFVTAVPCNEEVMKAIVGY